MPNKIKLKYLSALILVLLGIFVTRFCYVILNPLDSDAEMQRLSKTLAVLKLCDNSLKTWIVENHQVPTSDEGLSVLKLSVYPVRDGWGRTLIYKEGLISESEKFNIYSVGPNGTDENGLGDDVIYSGK